MKNHTYDWPQVWDHWARGLVAYVLGWWQCLEDVHARQSTLVPSLLTHLNERTSVSLFNFMISTLSLWHLSLSGFFSSSTLFNPVLQYLGWESGRWTRPDTTYYHLYQTCYSPKFHFCDCPVSFWISEPWSLFVVIQSPLYTMELTSTSAWQLQLIHGLFLSVSINYTL